MCFTKLPYILFAQTVPFLSWLKLKKWPNFSLWIIKLQILNFIGMMRATQNVFKTPLSFMCWFSYLSATYTCTWAIWVTYMNFWYNVVTHLYCRVIYILRFISVFSFKELKSGRSDSNVFFKGTKELTRNQN